RAAREAGVADRTARAIDGFCDTVRRWRGVLAQGEPGALAAFVEMVLDESGLRDFADGTDGDDMDQRRANLDEVVNAAGDFELPEDPVGAPPTLLRALQGFLQSVALVADSDAFDPESGAVTLMTLHAAKGLEFESVAVIGCEDGILPHSRAREGGEEVEEERRLMYVAITRAERSLTLSWCRERSRARLSLPQEPSRFIAEMDLSSGASGSRATVSNETARARLGALKDLLGAARTSK
ncbi:MAG: hypothetical protein EBS39_12675, partial [Gammaproteobacteria bacterium]|nr:hypothetical protein [Gammaproteobacteria bacterium]